MLFQKVLILLCLKNQDKIKMGKEVNKPCIFYLYIHRKLAEHSINYVIKQKEAVSYLHEWRIPKHLRIAILKELEGHGLIIKEKGKERLFRIKKPGMDFENVNKVFKHVGIL